MLSQRMEQVLKAGENRREENKYHSFGELKIVALTVVVSYTG